MPDENPPTVSSPSSRSSISPSDVPSSPPPLPLPSITITTPIDLPSADPLPVEASETALESASAVVLESASAVVLQDSEETSASLEEETSLELEVTEKHSGLVDAGPQTLSCFPADAQSPLLSVKSWEELDLNPELLKGVYSLGFARPSKIQEVALPIIINQKGNIIAQAHNGSGKTAAFALALLSHVDTSISDPQGLCLCPTRELAQQNVKVLRSLGKFTAITVYVCVPASPPYPRNTGAQILVATPGKMKDAITKRIFPLTNVGIFVLDEADVMIDHRNNMGPQVFTIRRSLRKSNLQTLLFSATYPDEVRSFATTVVPNANIISLKKEELTLTSVTQCFIMRQNDDNKYQALLELYTSMMVGQSIIFVNARSTAFSIAKKLEKDGHAVSLLCGSRAYGKDSLAHSEREKVMQEFRDGVTKVLVATDVISRGIDVPQVTLVVNYDIPRQRESESREEDCDYRAYADRKVDMETYIHRIGRTGRFGLKGLAVSIILPEELESLQSVRDFFNCKISELPANMDQVEEMVRKLRTET